MDWLTNDLKQEIKLTFEPKYGRQLTNLEISEIADNFTLFVELVIKMKHEKPKSLLRSKTNH